MQYSGRISVIITFCLLLFVPLAQAGLVINAGSPQTVCAGTTVTLGGNPANPTASGGTAPYTFSWSPTVNMSNPADSTPTVKVTATTWYYLTVTDFSGGRKVDSVLITVNSVSQANAGTNASICPFIGSANLGGVNNLPSYTYQWLPPTALSCTNCGNPTANPNNTTTYTLIAQNGGCSDTSSVTVTVLTAPTLTVVTPVTIQEGQTVTLSASGAASYTWTPTATLFNQNTATPQAFPSATTTYIVTGTGANGCVAFDSVRVIVEVDSNLVFYNTFTPNGDGINDTWYIGNIGLYPNNEVYIYNRYGKQVFYAYGYTNQWNGSNLGDELPDATYYYVVSTGTGTTYRGCVTIIRKP